MLVQLLVVVVLLLPLLLVVVLRERNIEVLVERGRRLSED